MSGTDLIRSLTRNQRLVELARSLHVAGPLKRWEYRLRGPRDGLVRHQIGGVEVVLAAPDATDFRTLEEWYGSEMDFIQALAGHLAQGGVFYDVGSNVGQFLIPMAKVLGERGEAIGFEPHPVNHQRLMRNLALNQLHNARALRVALGDRDGEAEIFGARGTATIMPHGAAQGGVKAFGRTKVARGDEYRQREGLPIPSAVKIDVEGAEYSVLQGLSKTLSESRRSLLCCEIHPRALPPDISPDRIVSLVGDLGFTVRQVQLRGTEIHLIAGKDL
jgi:FkbM family methyltransferase